MLQARARNHLGADKSGAETPSLAPKRLHADARHWGQNEAARDLNLTDAPGFVKIYLHRAAIVNVAAVATA